MGLFSNNKKPCPICGNATPRLLPTKVEGVPICKECDKKIDLPNGVLDSMTLDDFRRYIDFYNKNQALRERFHPEYRFGFGAFNTQLVLDVTNGLFRLKDDESTIVFEKSALKSFRITEDKEPLFTGTAAGLVCAESKNPERVRLLAPRIEQFKLQRSDYERIMQAERVQYLDRTNEEWRERERELEFHKPEFRESSPFRQFVVELELDHPYWKAYRNELDAPEFDDDYASTGNQLSMPRLYRPAALCRRVRQAGVRLLRRELRCGADRGALRGEGGQGCGSAAVRRGKGCRGKENRRGERVGYVRPQHRLGRGGRGHEGL